MCIVTFFLSLSSCSLYTWNRSKVAPPSPAPGIHLLLHLSACLLSQRMAAAQAGSGLGGTHRDGQVASLMPLDLCMCVFTCVFLGCAGWEWEGGEVGETRVWACAIKQVTASLRWFFWCLRFRQGVTRCSREKTEEKRGIRRVSTRIPVAVQRWPWRHDGSFSWVWRAKPRQQACESTMLTWATLA